MIFCNKWKNCLCKIVPKSQVVTKFNVTKSRLHCTATLVCLLETPNPPRMVPCEFLGVSGYSRPHSTYLYFQICVSFHMCLVTVYYIVLYWSYPLKNILGDTGCHIANFLRETGTLQIQLHSFIMATTRYIFLFRDNLLLRFNLTTNVSAILLQCGPSMMFWDTLTPLIILCYKKA